MSKINSQAWKNWIICEHDVQHIGRHENIAKASEEGSVCLTFNICNVQSEHNLIIRHLVQKGRTIFLILVKDKCNWLLSWYYNWNYLVLARQKKLLQTGTQSSLRQIRYKIQVVERNRGIYRTSIRHWKLLTLLGVCFKGCQASTLGRYYDTI